MADTCTWSSTGPPRPVTAGTIRSSRPSRPTRTGRDRRWRAERGGRDPAAGATEPVPEPGSQVGVQGLHGGLASPTGVLGLGLAARSPHPHLRRRREVFRPAAVLLLFSRRDGYSTAQPARVCA